ncbi:hypothetical protein BJX76DRAFT_292580 [Aspergillus varians]
MALTSVIPDWVWVFLDPHGARLGTAIAACCMVRGIRCIIQPGSQYYEFGVPREGSDDPRSRTEGTISPMMYSRGIRDVGYGIGLKLMSNVCEKECLTGLLGVGAIISLGDALVVLRFGRGQWSMVLFHLLVAGYFGWLYWARSQATYSIPVSTARAQGIQ